MGGDSGEHVAGGAEEGETAGDGLEEGDGEAPDVGGGVGLAAHELLGRHVVEGSDGAALFGEFGAGFAIVGDAEVDDFDDVAAAGAGGDEDVGRLEVAVDDEAGVGVVEGAGALADELDAVGQGHAAA